MGDGVDVYPEKHKFPLAAGSFIQVHYEPPETERARKLYHDDFLRRNWLHSDGVDEDE
jgi:hypothetical protein